MRASSMEPAAAGDSKPPAPAPLASDTTGATVAAASTPSASPAPASSLLAPESLVAVGLGGAALLVWWALAFHRANARLWMVPAGLVLVGTPLVAWLSVFASGMCGRRRVPPPAVLGA